MAESMSVVVLMRQWSEMGRGIPAPFSATHYEDKPLLAITFPNDTVPGINREKPLFCHIVLSCSIRIFCLLLIRKSVKWQIFLRKNFMRLWPCDFKQLLLKKVLLGLWPLLAPIFVHPRHRLLACCM